MKKVLIGLIIIAAGAGVFFYLRSKQITIAEAPEIDKTLILGTWKVDSSHSVSITDSSDVSFMDSIYKSTKYSFDPDGRVSMLIFTDTASASYEFKPDSVILWRFHDKDSTVLTHVNVLKLDSSKLVINAVMDSAVSSKLYLTREK